MKRFRSALRALIIAGSLSSFFGAWMMLAQAGKSAPDSNIDAAATPAVIASTPLPTLDMKSLSPSDDISTDIQPLPTRQPMPQRPSQLVPRLRTSGS